MYAHWLFGAGEQAPENLDRPVSNFDVAGIPREQWSSGIFACHKNLIPSCFMSFFCPCIMWGQIVVRAQIPLLIATKNSLNIFRGHSGYTVFVNTFLLVAALFIGFLLGGIFVPSTGLRGLLLAISAVCLLAFAWLLGHVRTAFKMKYGLPSALPRGSEVWDCVLDAFISVCCLPCALAQMARHVFQYDSWSPPLGLFYKDPYALPPLQAMIDRPQLADEAGILWTDSRPHPNAIDGRGSAHRQPGQHQQHQQHYSPHLFPQYQPQTTQSQPSAPTYQIRQPNAQEPVIATPITHGNLGNGNGSDDSNTGLVYRPDGSIVPHR